MGLQLTGLILIYSSSTGDWNIMRSNTPGFAIAVVHIGEVCIVLWVPNRMIKYDEQQEKLRFIELGHFPSTDGSICCNILLKR